MYFDNALNDELINITCFVNSCGHHIQSLPMNSTHTRYWSPGPASETTRDPEFPDSSLPNPGSQSAFPTFVKPYMRSTVTLLITMGCYRTVEVTT